MVIRFARLFTGKQSVEVGVVDSEQTLLSFGPLGVSVCDGAYRVFKWQWQNVFRIEFTDRCLRASLTIRFPLFGHGRKGASFEIPYAAVVSMRLLAHPTRLGVMQVIDITYRDAQGPGVHEKSIAAYNGAAESAFAVPRSFAPWAG